jgi:hypothetical protein
MGFLGKLVSTIRILQGSLRMPVSSFVIALFVVFGSGTMSLRRKFVLLGGSPVYVVHLRPPLRTILPLHGPSQTILWSARTPW